MLLGRGTNRRVDARDTASVLSWDLIPVAFIVSISLLSGCSESHTIGLDADYYDSVTWQNTPPISQASSSVVQAQPLADEFPQPLPLPKVQEPATKPEAPVEIVTTSDDGLSDELWEFPTFANEGFAKNKSELIPLPTVVEESESGHSAAGSALLTNQPDDSSRLLVARLLPPLPLVPAESGPLLTSPVETQTRVSELNSRPGETKSLPMLVQLSEQEQTLAALLRDSSSAATGVLTDQRINELAKSKVQHAYKMASRGSLYVAREELVEVLRMLSQAKDAQQGSRARTTALAAGLRALREAQDFVPRGTQLEAELDIGVLCASHRTPVAGQLDLTRMLPRTMMDRYLRYAQLQLAMSVAGEPAGSMALHAMGKLNSQLGRVEPDQNLLADRRAIAFQQAALLAHNQNHLAAHELGVLLASSGHLAEARQLLTQVAAREPNAIVFRNLARIQDQLGQSTEAVASRDYALQLTQQGATGTNNVQWVSPTQFAETSGQAPRYVAAQQPPVNRTPLPGSRRSASPTVRR